ncbi:hypothetical protein D9M72_452220 [compost metagenome]
MRSTGPIFTCVGKRARNASLGMFALTASTKVALRCSSTSVTTATRTPCLRSCRSMRIADCSNTIDRLRRRSSITGRKLSARSSWM